MTKSLRVMTYLLFLHPDLSFQTTVNRGLQADSKSSLRREDLGERGDVNRESALGKVSQAPPTFKLSTTYRLRNM